MSNYISEHLHKDEQKQKEIEASFAGKIQDNFTKNFLAFEKYIPNLANQLKQFKPKTTSVFINKFSQVNIVNYTTGKVLYPANTKEAIDHQLAHWEQRSVAYDLAKHQAVTMSDEDINDLGASHFKMVREKQDEYDTLVLFGLGTGEYLMRLIEQFNARYILLYETNWHFLFASLSICNWTEIFEYCASRNITIFVQTTIEFESDLKELASSTEAKSALIFQHFHTYYFDAFVRNMRFGTFELSEHECQCSEVDIWHSTINLEDWKLCNLTSENLDSNLKVFEEYYPNIAELFSSYNPKIWLPIVHKETGKISLFNKYTYTVYSPFPENDAERMLATFEEYPNREQLYMGYMGNKLNHFAFNHFYTEIGAVLASQEQTKSILPSKLELLIIFGLGNAFHLDKMFSDKDIKHLFLIEPNPDFFYWSLLVSDWSTTFSKIVENEGKMFLSIGQLDSGLTGELSRQFALIGNHHVAKTWIFQGYTTPSIALKFNEVRTTFRTLFSLSDNFEHAFYGLEHFLFSVERKLGYMTNKVRTECKKYANVPVFMVGNGPSVDDCVEQLIEYQDKAIIVSCGTTLKTLYNYNIVPDYHAEVELYRANYDWITQIPDRDYLSKITLICPDGVHPDNTKLFKNTLYALKNGESSTVIHKYLFPDHQFVSVSEAYPTVSNFCLSFLIHAGFQEIYLLGVDLGYQDPDRHHGKNSSYFEKDKTLYTVAKDESSILSVAGNFAPYVFTKHEFNMARTMMEQALAKVNIDCYNTANGAKISGSIPLRPEDMLVLSDQSEKRKAIAIFEAAFEPLEDEFMDKYISEFKPECLSNTITSAAATLPEEFSSLDEIDELVSSHEEVFRNSDANLLATTLLSSTIQCFFAALIKTSSAKETDIALKNSNLILAAYRELLFKESHLSKNVPERWDISVAFIERREQSLLAASEVSFGSYDEEYNAFFSHIIRPKYMKKIHISAQEVLPDIVFINTLEQIAAYEALINSKENIEGLIVCSNLKTLERAHELAVEFDGLAALYLDLSDYFSIYKSNEYYHHAEVNVPLLEHIETMLLVRYSQRFDFSAMCYKPRFDMKPHIRKLASDLSHPANRKVISDMVDFLNDSNTKIIFKHFVGIPKNDIKNGTFLDGYGNRGMRIKREIFPMEILDYCYISSNHHQLEENLKECLARV